MATKVIMPQLGESVVEGTVTKWLKQEGEKIEEYEALLEVNTDKVDTEIPSPAGGVLLKIVVPEGQTVTAGTVIAWVGEAGETVPENGGSAPAAHAQPAEKAAAAEPAVQPAEQAQPASSPAAGRDRDLGFISPVVARLAKDENVDLSQVKGTGEGGRITKKDVRAFVEQRGAAPQQEMAAWETPGEGDLFRPTELQFAGGMPGKTAQPPAQAKAEPKPAAAQPAAAAPAAGDRVIPLNNMRKAIAEHMQYSKRTAPHVTTVMEADLSRMIAHQTANIEAFARDGVRLTYTPYFIAAIVAALRAFPLVNSSWSEEGVVLHNAINIGMATSLGEDGLIVPIIRGADGLSLLGMARAVNDLADRARSRRLKPDEVQGGTFTITNHGIAGSLFATPVINQPQVGILGVGAIQKRVVVLENDAIAVRPMVYLSLTFDHRVLDGASADGFLKKVVEVLEKWS